MSVYFSVDLSRENRFWLQIFRDHSQFMLETLVPRETALISQAQQFYQRFDQLLQQADQAIHQQAAQTVMDFRCYQLSVVDLQLAGQVPINLPPGALNEMLDEADEYLRILGVLPVPAPVNEAAYLIQQHLLWLPNNAAHAALVRSQLDPGETNLFKMHNHYVKLFQQLANKVLELKGLMRDNPRMVPSLVYTTCEVARLTKEFIKTQENYREWRTTAQVLAISPPLLADHFIREAMYYLQNIGCP
ncbi:MAG TPA: DUF2935 domain-containing protein [Bacillota bacterium]|nr:DUF2935 domain-containing protein [Bacillota bacterium]